MSPRPTALLLRTPRAADPYVAALEAAGFVARCLPVLRFEPVGRDALAERMRRPNDYAGLLLTSPRSVEALQSLDLSAWQEKPAFAVGPATGERAHDLGLRPVGEESGMADELAEVVTARPFDRPLLFLCGDRRRDVLPDRLRAAGIAFDELTVYRTFADASGLPDAVERQQPEWMVFFSPSGVEAVETLARPSWNRIFRAAIGPTTADALHAVGVTPAAVAAAPTPEALAAALAHARRSPDA